MNRSDPMWPRGARNQGFRRGNTWVNAHDSGHGVWCMVYGVCMVYDMLNVYWEGEREGESEGG